MTKWIVLPPIFLGPYKNIMNIKSLKKVVKEGVYALLIKLETIIQQKQRGKRKYEPSVGL